jgi:hypothetical protein
VIGGVKMNAVVLKYPTKLRHGIDAVAMSLVARGFLCVWQGDEIRVLKSKKGPPLESEFSSETIASLSEKGIQVSVS